MIRPLYRWKSFWLGVLVLGFLGWGWRASRDRFTAYRVDTPIGWLAIGQYQGEAGLFSGRPNRAKGTWKYIVSDKRSSREIFRAEWENGSSRYALLVAPHSRIILLFLLPWTAFLAWRWRRMRRGISIHAPSHP